MKYLPFFVLGLFWISAASAQQLPKAFPLATHIKKAEKLYVEHQKTLIEVCENDMDSTFHIWMGTMVQLEKAAQAVGVDLNGMQLLLTFFWDPDGSIRHIAFSRLARSKNMPEAEVQALLIQFAKQFQLPLSYEKRFFHEGVATFPVRPQRFQRD